MTIHKFTGVSNKMLGESLPGNAQNFSGAKPVSPFGWPGLLYYQAVQFTEETSGKAGVPSRNMAGDDRAKQVRWLCEQGRWAEVLELTLDWQLDFPGDALAFYYHGIALAATGRPKEAEGCYRRALQLDSRNFKIWNNLAALLFEALNRPSEAVQCLAQALKLNPDNELGWANLASMHGQLGRHQQALECAERALALDPQLVEAHLHRARAAQKLHKPEIVRAASEMLAQLPPEKFKRTR